MRTEEVTQVADGEMGSITEVVVKVARLEERTTALEHWRDVLATDIAETKTMIKGIDTKFDQRMDQVGDKLDRTLRTASRSLPTWAHYMLWFSFTMLGVLATLLSIGKL